MSYPLKRIAAIFLLGGFAFHAGAQIMTEAEARTHTQRVEGGWKAVQVGDSAHSVEQKMGRPGSIIKGNNGRDDRWLYFTAHMSYVVIVRDGKVIAKESTLD
jgi:hypothetical protein